MLNLRILVGLKTQLRNFITRLRILKIATIIFFEAALYGLIYNYLERNLLRKKSEGTEDISCRGLIETDTIKPEKIKAREILGEDL